MTQPKAYSYIRFSRPEQMRGDSLRRQLNETRKFAEERGLELVEMADLGKSAYHGKHVAEDSALGRFLAVVKEGKIEPGSILLVEALDRLSRQSIDVALEQMLGLIRAGIRIITTKDGQVYDRESIRASIAPLMISIALMASAYDESKKKAERVGDAWEAKRKLASEIGKPLTARAPLWLRLKADRSGYDIIPERAAVVRRIYEETAAGIGRGTVTKRLNADGIPPFGQARKRRAADGTVLPPSPGRRYWHDSAVQKILDHVEVIGTYQPHKRQPDGSRVPVGDPIPGLFPPVIEEDLYWRAQAMRTGRRGTGGRKGPTLSNLFTGMCRCAECGGNMTRIDKGKPPKGAAYLICDRARRAAGCGNKKLWRYDAVERAVLASAYRLDLSRILPEQPEVSALAERIAAQEARLADVQRQRERWGILFAEGDDLAADQFRALGKEAKAIQADLDSSRRTFAEQQADQAAPMERMANVLALRAAIGDAQTEEDLFLLRSKLAQELRRVVRVIECSPSAVTITWGPKSIRPRLHYPQGYFIQLLPPVIYPRHEPQEADPPEWADPDYLDPRHLTPQVD